MLRALAIIAALACPALASAQQPCTSDARHVVNEIYRVMLERSADRGSNNFVQQLNRGDSTVREVVRAVALSSEHAERFTSGNGREAQEQAVGSLYRHILGRQADEGGLRIHADIMAAQGTGAVVDALLNSSEYQEKFGEYGVPGTSELRFCGPADRGQNQGQSGSVRRFPSVGDEIEWTAAGFADLDTNRDGRVARSEWPHDAATFNRVDRNRDRVIVRNEYLAGANATVGTTGAVDDEERFDVLDRNRSGRIERNEWDGTRAAFDALDANENNVLSRPEFLRASPGESGDFASLDTNRDGRLSIEEWNWNRRTFDQQDANGDGFISAREFTGAPRGR